MAQKDPIGSSRVIDLDLNSKRKANLKSNIKKQEKPNRKLKCAHASSEMEENFNPTLNENSQTVGCGFSCGRYHGSSQSTQDKTCLHCGGKAEYKEVNSKVEEKYAIVTHTQRIKLFSQGGHDNEIRLGAGKMFNVVAEFKDADNTYLVVKRTNDDEVTTSLVVPKDFFDIVDNQWDAEYLASGWSHNEGIERLFREHPELLLYTEKVLKGITK